MPCITPPPGPIQHYFWALLAVSADIGQMEPSIAWDGDGMSAQCCDMVVGCASAEVGSALFGIDESGQRLIDPGRR